MVAEFDVAYSSVSITLQPGHLDGLRFSISIRLLNLKLTFFGELKLLSVAFEI